jgi:hypothetical protein
VLGATSVFLDFICFLFFLFTPSARNNLTERAVATEKMEQPASSKAAGPVFVVRTCTRVNASTSVHDYLVLPLTRPEGGTLLFVLFAGDRSRSCM